MHVKFSVYSGVLYVARMQHIADIRLPATYQLRDLMSASMWGAA
jgi:hypothetical protein